MNAMTEFEHSYKMSAVVLAIMLALFCLGGIGSGYSLAGTFLTGLIAGALPFIPMRLEGGLARNWKLAVSISMILAFVFTGMLAAIFFELILNQTLNAGEGLVAAIFAIVFFALTLQFPWLLTSLRGLRLWRRGMKNNGLIEE